MEKIVKKNPFQSAKVQAQMLSQSGIQTGQFGMHRDIFTPHVILDFFLVVFFIFARLRSWNGTNPNVWSYFKQWIIYITWRKSLKFTYDWIGIHDNVYIFHVVSFILLILCSVLKLYRDVYMFDIKRKLNFFSNWILFLFIWKNSHFQPTQSSTLAVVRWPTASENWFGPVTCAKFFQ